MKTQKLSVLAVVMVSLFAVGALAGHALGAPLPASLLGLALVLLALRVGVMIVGVEEPAPAAETPSAPREPVLRAANG